MSTIIRDVDLVEGKVLVTFGDGTATMFNAQFLYVHRNDEGNEALPPQPDETSGTVVSGARQTIAAREH
jgi:hypothetical protein